MEALTVEREDFRLWLASKDPDEIVGQTNDGLQCPGTSFLRAIGLACPVVSYSGVGHWVRTCRNGSQRALLLDELPGLEWLSEFASSVDQRYGRTGPGPHGRSQPQDVTAKEALTVLDSLEFDAART